MTKILFIPDKTFNSVLRVETENKVKKEKSRIGKEFDFAYHS